MSHKSIAESLALTQLAETRWGPKRRWRCVYCGRGAGMAVDHVYPSSMGGGNNIHNLVPACDRCNSSKANLDPWEWMTAAGVPAIRQASIGRVIHLPAVTTGLQVPEERIILDYQAPKALKRPFQGIKGS